MLDGSCRLRGERDHHGAQEVRRHPLEIMRPLKHGAVLVQKPLTHATEGAQEVSHARPDPFDRVGMDFADAIAVIIPRPFALSRGMADGLMASARLCYVAIGRPFISVDCCTIAGMPFHE